MIGTGRVVSHPLSGYVAHLLAYDVADLEQQRLVKRRSGGDRSREHGLPCLLDAVETLLNEHDGDLRGCLVQRPLLKQVVDGLAVLGISRRVQVVHDADAVTPNDAFNSSPIDAPIVNEFNITVVLVQLFRFLQRSQRRHLSSDSLCDSSQDFRVLGLRRCNRSRVGRTRCNAHGPFAFMGRGEYQ